MPSDEALLRQAEDCKARGNAAFAGNDYAGAAAAYGQGLVACDRLSSAAAPPLKATLLSNRAMCHLRTMRLPDCIEDCTAALALDPDAKLRGKLQFRRAKASFLRCGTGGTSEERNDLLQSAGKDLLALLHEEPGNKEAADLLTAVRAQHKRIVTATTPVAKELEALREGRAEADGPLKRLLGLLEHDPRHAPLELGRRGGVDVLLRVAADRAGARAAVLALTCLSVAGARPEFVREHLVETQTRLRDLMRQVTQGPEATPASAELVVFLLAILVRIVLHCDRDDPDTEISGKTRIDYHNLVEMTNLALTPPQAPEEQLDKTVIRAVLDLLSSWTAGKDRDATIRNSLHSSQQEDPLLPLPKSKMDLHSMSPQEFAAHQKRAYDQRCRDEAWLYERARLYLQEGLPALLRAGAACREHAVRREVTVVVSRLCAGVEDNEKLKAVLTPYLQDHNRTMSTGATKTSGNGASGVIIEEILDDDEEEEGKVVDAIDNSGCNANVVSLETKMERAIITTALLMSNKDCGAWALGSGWTDSQSDLSDMINSDDPRAMCLASEVISAAATLESAAELIKQFIDNGAMAKLVMHDDRDIRSGAASAVAKLGLTNREKQRDETELMTMLQGACDLIEDRGEGEATVKASNKKGEYKSLQHFSSFASSSVERGIEMINYLVANTSIKEELAAGYHCDVGMKHSALDRLVEICDMPMAGESLSGFALASIFQHMAVTNQELRKEMFEGKEYTMEQYDQMQEMGKTDEEKELLKEQNSDPDTPASCNERIRKMAAANVPHALVNLIEGASEHTLEQVILTIKRMACEQSTRGVLIQQGILSALIKIEKQEQPTDTDTMKKLVRFARHSIAKLLVTQNPSLLTSAQRLGSIKPLLQLIRDIHASDLEQFEALMALTNIAGSGEDAANRIVTEKGIGPLHYCMFSDHELVQQAATEALCNLIPHPAILAHLREYDNLRLWLAFAEDADGRYACARAAAGALAMATQDGEVARGLVGLPRFGEAINSMLQCGRPEIMHRAFVLVLNLVRRGGECRDRAVSSGAVAFVKAFLDRFHGGTDLDFPPEEQALLPVIVNIGKDIVRTAEEAQGQ